MTESISNTLKVAESLDDEICCSSEEIRRDLFFQFAKKIFWEVMRIKGKNAYHHSCGNVHLSVLIHFFPMHLFRTNRQKPFLGNGLLKIVFTLHLESNLSTLRNIYIC